ncbi:MAG: class I SAM-dependent methyltransferase [Actinomycetota bacterium]|nr:class I SAM-dependent methyltransferase [Actinomycetota bacterium]
MPTLTESKRIEDLRQTSPFEPEPPRKSRIVSALMRVAERRRNTRETPHLHGGSAEDKVLWEYERSEDFWERIAHLIPFDSIRDKDVLDVGCGWGGKMIHWAETGGPRSVTGFDLPGVFEPEAPAELARARGLDNLSFTTGFAEDIPFDDESFDVAIVDDVIEHVRDPERVFAECHRVLRPGGIAIAKFPSFRMMRAHHLDRAIAWPALHYVLPMRVWAGGLNHHLVSGAKSPYEPFGRIIRTRYHEGIISELNGIDLRGTREALGKSGLEVVELDLLGLPPDVERSASPLVKRTYSTLRRVRPLREFLSSYIAFVARRPIREAGNR